MSMWLTGMLCLCPRYAEQKHADCAQSGFGILNKNNKSKMEKNMKSIEVISVGGFYPLRAYFSPTLITGALTAKVPLYKKSLLPVCFSILAVFVTAGCGGNSSNSNPSATENRGALDSLEPDESNAIDDNKVNVIKRYIRDEEYPELYVSPLQFITTQSGKKLGVRIALPATGPGMPANGPFPVILTQSGYNPNLMFAFMGPQSGGSLMGVPDSFMIKRGYAHVIVDTLGTGVSEGDWEMLGEAEQA